MPITAETHERVAFEDPEGRWELHHGRLRGKPGMTFAHDQEIQLLAAQLHHRIDLTRFTIRINRGHVNRAGRDSLHPGSLRGVAGS